MQQLQEKHALETGALLSALADSQRTTRVLRDENEDLRERVASIEGELEEAGVFVLEEPGPCVL